MGHLPFIARIAGRVSTPSRFFLGGGVEGRKDYCSPFCFMQSLGHGEVPGRNFQNRGL